MNQPVNTNIAPVTLEQILNAREQRQSVQSKLLKQYQSALICLTINMPGKFKLTKDSIFLFNEAVCAIEPLAKKNNWQILYQQQQELKTGPEGYWVIATRAATKIKKKLIELEQKHPLGRLWDIDVFSPETGYALSRKMLAIEPRACLICDQPAKVCARSQQHSLLQLLTVIQNKITNYRNSHAFEDDR